MSRRLPNKVREHLSKACESSLAAVAAYNNPRSEFRTGTYIVLMVIAWTSLFHAIFYKRSIRPWCVISGSGRGTRYYRVGRDYRHWQLRECLSQFYFEESTPVRQNLNFLIGLRDRIEHRNMPVLDHEVFGECQACLINFEALLEEEFGSNYALNASLAFSLQFSGLLPDKRVEAMKALRRSATDSVVEYVRTFRAELAPEIANDQRFEFKVFLLPQLANHRSTGTLAVEWLPMEQADQQTLQGLDRAIVLVKQRQVPTRGKVYLPGAVVQKVAKSIPWRFRYYEHIRCWRYFKVRPPKGVSDPSKCDDKFCQWDPAFSQYVYTDGWIRSLCDELQDRERFREIVGKQPIAATTTTSH